jgi:MoxR-like ATPase
MNSLSISEAHQLLHQTECELRRALIGQDDLIRSMLVGLVANGHLLIEGVPGLGKTRLVNLLSKVCQLAFKRLQFTPDLLPADILGTRIYNQTSATFETVQGPIFANFVLADEINRAPAKVQSALLETMQERQVTIGRESIPLEPPFLVFATQNPIEQEGTYPLPEAQLDRFLLKLVVTYPEADREGDIVRMVLDEHELPKMEKTLSREQVLAIQEAAREVFIEKRVVRYAVDLVQATRTADAGSRLGNYLELGASPRASISLAQAARAMALLEGKKAATPHHVKSIAKAALRHRLILTYHAEAEGVTTDELIDELLHTTPVP